MVERTEDGRYIVVSGRRWRATDPSLPQDLVGRLTSHLGKARSSIRHAEGAELTAWRARVQTAKEGLGERGTPWWELSHTERSQRAQDALETLDAEDLPTG